MKTRSFPFDSVAQGTNELGFVVGDRDYGSADWSKYISYFLTNGIKNGGDNLKVLQSSETQVSVLDGIALINGRFFEMYEGPGYFDVPLNSISRIIVRLNLADSVRNIDLKIIEGTSEMAPELVRDDEVYDLSLAKIITDENEITEIVDERADNMLCGYINSMITVDVNQILSSIENELKKIENQSNVALKNGDLQTNLNAEKLGGKTLDSIMAQIKMNSLVNYPTSIENNILNFDNIKLDAYQKGQCFKFAIPDTAMIDFEDKIIPQMTSSYQDGYNVVYPSSNNAYTEGYKLFDRVESTYVDTSEIQINFPKFIAPTLISYAVSKSSSYGYPTLYGIRSDGTLEVLKEFTLTASGMQSGTLELSGDTYYKGIGFKKVTTTSSSRACFFELSIDSGKYINYLINENKYININNIGPKLINSEKIFPGAIIELVYDGNTFIEKGAEI